MDQLSWIMIFHKEKKILKKPWVLFVGMAEKGFFVCLFVCLLFGVGRELVDQFGTNCLHQLILQIASSSLSPEKKKKKKTIQGNFPIERSFLHFMFGVIYFLF